MIRCRGRYGTAERRAATDRAERIFFLLSTHRESLRSSARRFRATGRLAPALHHAGSESAVRSRSRHDSVVRRWAGRGSPCSDVTGVFLDLFFEAIGDGLFELAAVELAKGVPVHVRVCLRRLSGLVSVQACLMKARHSSLEPRVPSLHQPFGGSVSARQSEYCSSALITTS